MRKVTFSEFRKCLTKQVDRCADSHEALKVLRRDGQDFVVLSAADWAAVEETMHLNKIPGMVESIHASHAEPLGNGTPLEKLDW
jgi:PHD/YefM family antitoxin component YafN of YafNO toxin-antitoxin module